MAISVGGRHHYLNLEARSGVHAGGTALNCIAGNGPSNCPNLKEKDHVVLAKGGEG
jgi:hypothetical protein